MYVIYRLNGKCETKPIRIYMVVPEESLDIAMEALEAGYPTLRFEIRALDISEKAVAAHA